MAFPHPPRVRDRQRGNSLLIALVVMSALATLGSLTVVSVQSGLQASTNDRNQAIATYAAESGAAVTMDYLRNHWLSANAWGNYVTRKNGGIAMTAIPGNDVPPEDPTSLFTKEQNAWFDIRLLNNTDDPGYDAPDFGTNDQDGRIIIHATGHGPQGSVAIIEWEVQRLSVCPPPPAPPPPLCTSAPPLLAWPEVPSTVPLILRGWHIATPL